MAGRLGILRAELAHSGGRFDTSIEQHLRSGQEVSTAMIKVAARPYRIDTM
jgi:hypothetical protein